MYTVCVYVSTTASFVQVDRLDVYLHFVKHFLCLISGPVGTIIYSVMEVPQHSGYTTCCNIQSDP